MSSAHVRSRMAGLKRAMTLVLLLVAASLAGCVSDDGDDDDGEEHVSTLDTVIERDSVICGVKSSQAGMGFLNSAGEYEGLDIEYCKAIAAAVLGDSSKVTYKIATAGDRFELLASEEIDVLIRTTTWTTSRDADLGADFGAVNFYDGQAIMTTNTNATSALDLNGSRICVQLGTTTEGNLQDYFAANNMEFTSVGADSDAASKVAFESGSCDAWTGDASNMAAQKAGLSNPSSAKIMPELLSKEPLASATRDNDDEWNDVVTWVWYAMLTAEELGINSSNVAAFDTSSNPSAERLLNGVGAMGLGTEDNSLGNSAFKNVISQVGNYQEAYDRAFCDGDGTESNCLMDRAGSLNAPYWEGGLMYAPPIR